MIGRHAHIEDRLGAIGCVEVPRDCAKGNIRRLRLLPRRATKIDAVARTSLHIGHIEIRNISQGGAGLRITIPTVIDEVIVLHLADGREIACRVRWARMGFCGVEFLTRLELSDALLDGISVPPVHPAGELAGPRTLRAGLHRVHWPDRPGAGHGFKRLRHAMAAYAASARRIRRRLIAWRLLARFRKEARALERACRRQGFHWLVDLAGITRQPIRDRAGSIVPARPH